MDQNPDSYSNCQWLNGCGDVPGSASCEELGTDCDEGRLRSLNRSRKAISGTTLLQRSPNFIQEVVFELIDTERQYVADLKQLIAFCMQPCLKWGILEKEDAGRLFLNIETLCDLNSKFLASLESLQSKSFVVTDPVGPIVLAHTDMFKLYAVYCAHQKPATFDELRASNEKFADFVQACSKRDDWRGVPLSAYLHKPIARICKYPLLLSQLLKYTPKESPDYAAVSDALDKLKAVVDRINERTRQVEMMNRLDEIEKSLGDSTLLLSSFHSYLQGGQDLGLALHSRKLIREALAFDSKSEEVRVFVTLQSQPPQVHVYLFNDMLLLARPRKSKPGKYELRRHALLVQVTVSESADTLLELTWTAQDVRDVVRFASKDDRDAWKTELQGLIRAAHGAQDRLQKGSVVSVKNLALQQRPSSPMLGRSEKRLLLVHWPAEVTGLADYSKVLAPEAADTVVTLLQKMLASPLARESPVPLKLEEWGLYSERLGTWFEDNRTLASYNLQDKESVFFGRKSSGSESARQAHPTPQAVATPASVVRLPLSGLHILQASTDSSPRHVGSTRSARTPSPLPQPSSPHQSTSNGKPAMAAELESAQRELKRMEAEMGELRLRLLAAEAERDELRVRLQTTEQALQQAHAQVHDSVTQAPQPTGTARAALTRASPVLAAAVPALAKTPSVENRLVRAESGRGPAVPRPQGLANAARSEASPLLRVMPPPSAAPPPLVLPPPPTTFHATTAPMSPAQPSTIPTAIVHPTHASSLDAVLQAAAAEIAATRRVPLSSVDINAWKTALGRLVRSAETLGRLSTSPGWAEIKIDSEEKEVIKRRVADLRRDAASATPPP